MFRVKLTAGDFRDLASAAVMTSGDKSRELLTGVLLEIEANTIRAIATDSYRLVTIEREAVEVEGTGPALVPGDVLERAAKDAKKARAMELVELVVDDYGVITITGPRNEWVYGGSMVEGKYPDVKSLIPEANGTKCEEGTVLAFNAFFLADFPKLAPWCNLARGEKGGPVGAIRITAINGHLRPIRLESSDGRTVIVIMPVQVTK